MLKVFLSVIVICGIAFALLYKDNNVIKIKEQGSFTAGGTVVKSEGNFDARKPFDPAGQTLHGDHLYVFYQTPVHAKKQKLVFLHGAGQSAKTWESTPDGREGFQNIFLRKGYGVYLVDQPRRGKAGRSTMATAITPITDDQMWFTQFRIGVWPKLFDNSKFPKDKEALAQFFRQMTPNTGEFSIEIISDALSALYNRIGEGVLVTHSQGGGSGWMTAIKNSNVKAIVSYEPGSNFIFPKGEVPEPIANKFANLSALSVPMEDFKKLTQIPIVIYYGDHIPQTDEEIPGFDYWRACLKMARIWAETINKHGGDAKVIYLPDIGINGNTHFPFSDLNNLEIADLMAKFLKEKGL